MHNCKSARNSFIDLALDEIPPGRSRQLLAELSDCRECHDEYAALRSTLHVSTQALRSTSPRESFWPGYHDRLRQALLAGSVAESGNFASESRIAEGARTTNGLWPSLRALLTTSVRVPLPAALALAFVFVMSVVGLRSLGEQNSIPAMPIATVETRTVLVPVVQEKPVVHEKIVTRVVYARQGGRREESDRTLTGSDNTLAEAASESSRKTALNLVGFVPTDELKLTIIKGSDPK
ncbi:MAG TPA: hypothetical protein VGC61_00405 [Pyrinomonadaceae bacterium]|jgi:hypothetical protein